MKSSDFESKMPGMHITVLPFPNFLSRGESRTLTELRFPFRKTTMILAPTSNTRITRGLNELVYGEHLEQCLAQNAM